MESYASQPYGLNAIAAECCASGVAGSPRAGDENCDFGVSGVRRQSGAEATRGSRTEYH